MEGDIVNMAVVSAGGFGDEADSEEAFTVPANEEGVVVFKVRNRLMFDDKYNARCPGYGPRTVDVRQLVTFEFCLD